MSQGICQVFERLVPLWSQQGSRRLEYLQPAFFSWNWFLGLFTWVLMRQLGLPCSWNPGYSNLLQMLRTPPPSQPVEGVVASGMGDCGAPVLFFMLCKAHPCTCCMTLRDPSGDRRFALSFYCRLTSLSSSCTSQNLNVYRCLLCSPLGDLCSVSLFSARI